VEEFISGVTRSVETALKTCISSSSEPVSIGSSPFAAAWFGISGADSPAAIANVTPSLSTLLGIPIGPRLVVVNDTHLLAAPVQLHSDVHCAIAVIAGTGAIAVSFRENEGKIEELGRVGGWGWILGDEGSGFHVGRETIRQMLMESDLGSINALTPSSSKLKELVMERFGVKNVMEILTGVYSPDPSPASAEKDVSLLTMPREKRLSSLCPLVFTAAFDHHDPFALNILKTCASLLASQILVLLAQNDLDINPRLVKASESVISFGGSLVGVADYRKLILDDLAERGHVFRRVEFINDAAAVGVVGLAASFASSSVAYSLS